MKRFSGNEAMIGVDEGGADWFYALLDAGLPLGSEEDVQVTKEDRPVALPEHFPLMRDVTSILGVSRIIGKSLKTANLSSRWRPRAPRHPVRPTRSRPPVSAPFAEKRREVRFESAARRGFFTSILEIVV